MKISNDILNALRCAIDELGSQTELMKASGVNQKSISAYLSGRNKKINLENWTKLEPLLHPYLPFKAKITYNQQHAGTIHQGNCNIHNSSFAPDIREAIFADPDLTTEQKKKIILEIEEMRLNNKFKT